MIYGYARVSTKGQARDGNSLEAQESALKAAGATEIFVDAFTGTKMVRPQLNELLLKVRKGDTIVVSKLDRIARSATEGNKMISSWLDSGINVHVLNMGLMDNSPTGKLIRSIMLSFAEFERDMIVQRTQEGKAVAKANNPEYKEGRKRKFPKDAPQIIHAVDNGELTVMQACEQMNICKSTYYRIKRDLQKEWVA